MALCATNSVNKWMAVPAICVLFMIGYSAAAESAIRSYDTGHTIIHVRTGILSGQSVIGGANYEDAISAMDFDGKTLWDKPNPLTGYMVRDLWCGDVNNDGDNEILAALSDGKPRWVNMRPRSPLNKTPLSTSWRLFIRDIAVSEWDRQARTVSGVVTIIQDGNPIGEFNRMLGCAVDRNRVVVLPRRNNPKPSRCRRGERPNRSVSRQSIHTTNGNCHGDFDSFFLCRQHRSIQTAIARSLT
ncbi:Lambda-carrageenase precursor [Planctomycetes bacterium CA13]|uniref:Lambda-carrageenase n=1 Tax=Novipirellula herctigrandis TaxID=2527986 RepID=A0A5C5Z3M0_9BACT|nr:Lambda-carrageenase precursor [Planctomycetes bacterium CA13]